MKKLTLIFTLLAVYTVASAQFVAKVDMTKEDIPGICDKDEVYALFPSFKGQVEAVCPVSNDTILARLNNLPFLKANPKYKGEGMVGIFINCKGEVVKCDIDNKTGNAELDKQILEVFNALPKTWRNAFLDGRAVDSTQLFSYTIKKGKVVEFH